MDPVTDKQLHERLTAFVRGLTIDPGCELNDTTSLLQSGLCDSAATLQLAEWVQGEVGPGVNLLEFDLSKEWDTIADIERFVLRHRGTKAG